MLGVDDDHSVNYEKGQRPTKKEEKTIQLFSLLPYSAGRDGSKHTVTLRLAVLFVFRFSMKEKKYGISLAHTLTKKLLLFKQYYSIPLLLHLYLHIR